MDIEKFKPGMRVFALHRYRMGNTKLKTVAVYDVLVKEVDLIEQSVVASVNGNPPSTYYHKRWSKWKLNRPVLVKGAFCQQRLATREEKAALKAKAESEKICQDDPGAGQAAPTARKQ